jgi:hypothetical protein
VRPPRARRSVNLLATLGSSWSSMRWLLRLEQTCRVSRQRRQQLGTGGCRCRLREGWLNDTAPDDRNITRPLVHHVELQSAAMITRKGHPTASKSDSSPPESPLRMACPAKQGQALLAATILAGGHRLRSSRQPQVPFPALALVGHSAMFKCLVVLHSIAAQCKHGRGSSAGAHRHPTPREPAPRMRLISPGSTTARLIHA